jgi:hypothetical protein
MIALAFIIGLIMGHVTKAHLYRFVVDKFIEQRKRREQEFECLIGAKNEVIKELEKNKIAD